MARVEQERNFRLKAAFQDKILVRLPCRREGGWVANPLPTLLT